MSPVYDHTNHHPKPAVGRVPDRPSHPRAVHTRVVEGRAEEPSAAFAENQTGGFSRLLATLPLSIGLTAAVGLILVTVATAIAYRSPDPTAWATPLSMVALAVTSVIGGLLAGKRYKDAPVVAGFLSGSVLAVVLLLVSFLFDSPQTMPPAVIWLTRLGTVLCHMLGACLGRPKQKAAAHTSPAHGTGKHHGHR